MHHELADTPRHIPNRFANGMIDKLTVTALNNVLLYIACVACFTVVLGCLHIGL